MKNNRGGFIKNKHGQICKDFESIKGPSGESFY